MIRGAAALSAGHRRVLGVQQAERVALEPVALRRRQRVRVAAVVRDELRDVGGAAGGVADRVDEDLDAGDAGLRVEPVAELDDLGVDGRARVPDRLDVELPELAVAAGLRPVVAEHRPGRRELHGLRQRLHPVLDVRADDARGRLRAERPGLGLLGPRRDPEQLLLDDVGDLADPPLEHRGLLEQRRLDRPVPVALRQARGDPLQAVEHGPLVGQEVTGAPGGSEGWHRAKDSRRGWRGGRSAPANRNGPRAPVGAAGRWSS